MRAPESTPAAAARAPAAIGPASVIDFDQAVAMLRITLLRAMRGRMVAGRSGKPRSLIFLLVMYGVLGFVLGMLAFDHPDVFSFSLLIWSFTFLTAGLTMIAESSTLLFDPRDNDILGHRPIHPRTLLLARSLALLLLALMLGLAIGLVPMFTGIVVVGARPWFPLAHLVTLLLLVQFSAAMVVLAYGLMARFVSRRTFDTVASWTQVGVTVLLLLVYQLVPRLMEGIQGFRIEAAHPLLLFLPPTWFAALTQLMMGTGASPRMLVLAALAVVSTPVVGWVALRYLAGDYAREVAALSETPVPEAPTAIAATARARRGARIDGVLRFWLRDPVERGAFRLAAAYLTRDRDMRMRLYPQLAGFLVLAFVAVVDRKTGPNFGPLICLYFAGTLPAAFMMTLETSPQYAAADIFRVVPIAGTASIFHGVRKATLILLLAPSLLVCGVILWFGLADHHGLLIALPALLTVPTLSLVTGLRDDYLPLSLPPTSGRQGAINAGMMILGVAWLALFSALAWFADRSGQFWTMIVIEIAALAVVHPLLLRVIRARPLSREGAEHG